jgi:hypothetical protein
MLTDRFNISLGAGWIQDFNFLPEELKLRAYMLAAAYDGEPITIDGVGWIEIHRHRAPSMWLCSRPF